MNAGHVESPRRPDGLGRKLLRGCAYTLAGLALLGAATLTGLRVLLPEIGRYRPQVEAWLSRAADRQVEVGAIEAGWRGWTPVFRVRNVRLAGSGAAADTSADPDGAAPGAPADRSIRIADLRFSVDPLDLLRSGALQPRNVAVGGASFVVVRRLDGTFAVGELGGPAPAGPRGGGRLVQWMPGQARVSLLASRIVWIDEQRGLPPLPFDGVTLHLEHAGDRYRISGAFEPPGGGRIDFATDLAGDGPAPPWTGAAYVAARDVDLARLGLGGLLPGAEAVSGVVSGQAWSTWKDGRFVEAEGTISARSPGVVHRGSRRGLDEVGASFTVEHHPEGWTLAVRDLAVATANGAWPVSGAGAKWTPPREGREGALVVNAEFVRIEDVIALAAPNGEENASPVLSTLFEAAPGGAVEALRISVPVTDRVELERARASGRFTRLRIGREDWPASVHAANGGFEANEQGFMADVVAGGLRASLPGWLAQPLEGEELAGALTVRHSPEGFRMRFAAASETTQVGRITAEGWTFMPPDERPPELSVALSLEGSRFAAVRTLIADGAIPEPVLHWLDSAVPQGAVRGVRLHLSEASFSAGTGALEATATLAAPVLRYARGWPEIMDVSAVARLEGSRLDIRFDSGRILESAIPEATVTIEDVGAEAPVAQVEARIEGASANAVRFLAESPLRARFTPLIDRFAIHGGSTIDLDLAVPLTGEGRSITVAGRIALDDNRIDAPELPRGLVAVNGTIAFRGSAVESDGITATWLGEPIRAVVGASPEAPHATRLSIDGRLTPRLLAAWLDDAGLVETAASGVPPLLARLRGETAWKAILDVPRAGGAGRPVKLRIASDLAGLSLDLPPPFGKPGGIARRLGIDSRFTSDAERIIEVRHGGLAGAALRLVRDPETGRFRLERGAVRLGDEDATLPDTPGVTVHGALPVLDTGAWRAFLADATARHTPDADAAWLGLLREVSIDAGTMIALGARFPDTRIRVAPGDGGGWWLDLAGPRLEGAVQIPSDPGTAPVTMGLERFVLEPGSAGAGSESRPLDPRTLPALSFSAGRFVLGDVDLGRVSFTTAPSGNGMALQRLDVQAGSFAGDATGSWSLAGKEHRTAIAMRLYGDDLGRMLGSLGSDGSAVTGGATTISLRGSWPGSPADFALERLAGVMHFLSTDGRLTRIESGVTGRVFGLLTITSLPRRLILDFSDLFEAGFRYDRIDGNFAVENGNAHTEDLFMESDTARIEVVGRTGLVSEDYEKLVTVIPKISSSLPLLPVWLAEKILDRNVFNKAFSYQYTITGPWDEPVVELVRTRRRQEEEDEE